MKTRLISPGIYALAVLFLIGIWLVIAPFALSTQPAGANWQVATIDDIAAGGGLIVVSLLGILVSVALSLSAAVRMVNSKRETVTGKE
jgi:hypothetical protein